MGMKDQPADLTKYRTMLAETAAYRGVSLWKDGWRRLRRNRPAVFALGLLVVVLALAFFAPLLPLQSPRDQDLANRQLLPPELKVRPLPINSARLREFDAETAKKKQALAAASSTEARTKLAEDLQSHLRTHPFYELWSNPGPVMWQMLRLRVAVFGDWCVPSLCGTDSLGRDTLSRICWGLRVSLLVGLLAAAVSLVLGVTIGAVAGYSGGWVDWFLTRVIDIVASIPFIFVVILMITVFSGEGWKEWLDAVGISQITVVYLCIGAFYWLTMARVVRGQILSLKNEQFVDAARTCGARAGRIIFFHLVPNVAGIVIVYLTLTIPSVMLTEAFLSFLGLGVRPPAVSLGGLVNDGIRVITPLKIYWWLVLFPGLVLAVTLLALNLLGDGLRDALDPRLKNKD
jgi:oligopeptide transport system permease protein